MDDPWFFEYETVDGKIYAVEASGPGDIWVWNKDVAVKWASLDQIDQDKIKEKVEDHFFYVSAHKSWSNR